MIPDGATIQFGIGGTPDAVLAGLFDRRDLGVHSGILSDAFVDLVEAGVITNRHKEIDTGVSVTGALLGTSRLYDWARDNPALSMRAASYTHDGTVLAALDSLHAINSAVEVDLTGQINGESAGGRYVGLVGGQGAFARAALMSTRGPLDRGPAGHRSRRDDLTDRGPASATASCRPPAPTPISS